MKKRSQIQPQNETSVEDVLTAVENFVMGRASSLELTSVLYSAGLDDHRHDQFGYRLELHRLIREYFLGYEDNGSNEHPIPQDNLIPNTPEAKKVAFKNFSRDSFNCLAMLRLEDKLQIIQQNINHSDAVLNHASSDSASSCCIIMKANIKYDNPFLNNHSLLDVFNQGGVDAVNKALGLHEIIGSSNGNDCDFA